MHFVVSKMKSTAGKCISSDSEYLHFSSIWLNSTNKRWYSERVYASERACAYVNELNSKLMKSKFELNLFVLDDIQWWNEDHKRDVSAWVSNGLYEFNHWIVCALIYYCILVQNRFEAVNFYSMKNQMSLQWHIFHRNNIENSQIWKSSRRSTVLFNRVFYFATIEMWNCRFDLFNQIWMRSSPFFIYSLFFSFVKLNFIELWIEKNLNFSTAVHFIVFSLLFISFLVSSHPWRWSRGRTHQNRYFHHNPEVCVCVCVHVSNVYDKIFAMDENRLRIILNRLSAMFIFLCKRTTQVPF